MERERMNRKLIRPNLSDYKERMSRDAKKKSHSQHPQYETFAENYYYLKQMNKKTSVIVVFTDGETIEGFIEWYDRDCLKLNRDGAPNLLVYKHSIKYIYKQDSKKSKSTERPTRPKPSAQKK